MRETEGQGVVGRERLRAREWWRVSPEVPQLETMQLQLAVVLAPQLGAVLSSGEEGLHAHPPPGPASW